MRYKLLLIVWVSLWVLHACQNSRSESDAWAALEARAQHDTSLTLADEYLQFSEAFPLSGHAPKALLKSAHLVALHGLTALAIERYRKVIERFPSSVEAAQACFLIGFAYSNILGDTLKARLAFEAFLKNYPESELVPSAQLELSLIGKSLNDLFKSDSLQNR